MRIGTDRAATAKRVLVPVPGGVALTMLCAVLVGCVSTPERRPLTDLVQEARAASQADERPPMHDAYVVQASAEIPPPNRLPPPHAGPHVSDTFVESDVREALQILASQAGVSVIIDEQVRGLTSAVIENEPFEAALEKLLAPLGYVYRKVGNQYLVGVPDPTSALFPRIADRHDFYATHLSPPQLLQLLPDRSKSFVRISEGRNLMIVEAPRQIAQEILEDLHRSDQPVEQVVLEAIVCVISPESGMQFGFDLEQGFRLDGDAALNLGISGLNMVGQYGPFGMANFRDFTFTAALLKALAREGYVKIHAAPHVMAKDGETATITIAKETFFSTQPANAQLLFRQDIQKIEAGITLDITPVIRGDHVTVHIERAELSEGIDSPSVANDGTNTFPIINRRRVSTTVHVSDGETITIGGLVQRQQVERIHRLPILGSIPYIGVLFQQIDRREEETEVVIFISPRIVRQ